MEAPAQSLKVILTEPVATGRRGHSDQFYLELAERYVALCDKGTRALASELQEQLEAEHISYSVATIHDFIREARRRGLLSPAPSGRAGGHLTDRAQELQRQRQDDRDYLTRRQKWVNMWHPETGGKARVTRLAFDEVWEPKGWKLADESKPKKGRRPR